jgi:hypothetical protein
LSVLPAGSDAADDGGKTGGTRTGALTAGCVVLLAGVETTAIESVADALGCAALAARAA